MKTKGDSGSTGRPPQRDRLRSALTGLCFERGYSATTLELLLERAEVDERSFRREFDDLEDCLCSIIEEQRTELLAAAWNAFSHQQGWANQMRAVALTMVRFAQEDHHRARTLLVEAELAGDRAKLIRDQGLEIFSAFIDTGRNELDDPDSISPASANMIGASIFGQVRGLVEKGEFDQLMDSMPEMMYSVVLPYLGSAAALRELRIPPGAMSPPGEPQLHSEVEGTRFPDR